MGTRERRSDIGAARARELISTVLRDLRAGRIDRGLSGAAVARAVGLSPGQYSRIERGLSGSVSIEQVALIAAAIGSDLSVRVYPSGQPIRDAAHAALIRRFQARIHPSLRLQTEVPFPDPHDRRAWDAVLQGPSWRLGVEAETRPRDRQALERRLALKLRDGDVSSLVLLLLDSRYNRDFVRSNDDAFHERFPMPGPRCMELLKAGIDPGASSIVLL
jgi:transcriptional regulator with XRE-family HTH domain